MNILTLYNNCYIILTTYMIESALEPSHNLSNNILLLPYLGTEIDSRYGK